jgi:hypothetical protein
MKRLSRYIAMLTLVFVAVVPVSALAYDDKGRGKMSDQLKIHGKPGMKPNHGHHQPPAFPMPGERSNKHSHQGNGLLQQTLFVLLAEKYSPYLVNDWKTTIAAHNSLRTQLQNVVKAKPRLANSLRLQHTEDLKTKLEQDSGVRKKLQLAIDSKNTKSIQKSLVSFLDQLKERNKLIAARLAALKKAP